MIDLILLGLRIHRVRQSGRSLAADRLQAHRSYRLAQ